MTRTCSLHNIVLLRRTRSKPSRAKNELRRVRTRAAIYAPLAVPLCWALSAFAREMPLELCSRLAPTAVSSMACLASSDPYHFLGPPGYHSGYTGPIPRSGQPPHCALARMPGKPLGGTFVRPNPLGDTPNAGRGTGPADVGLTAGPLREHSSQHRYDDWICSCRV